MKKMFSFILFGVVLLGLTRISMAVTSGTPVDFILSATMPAATGVSMSLNKLTGACITSPTGVCTFTPITGTALSYGTLSLTSGTNPTTGQAFSFFAPSQLFAIDVAPTGGAGSNNITLSYTEGSKPIGQVDGLGKKAVITYVKNVSDVETQLGKKLLSGLSTTVSSSSLSGGYFRAYVGIVTDPSAVTGSQVFSTADLPGTYTGTLTITATLV